uniref:Vacuolar protein sorting-associated protein 11 homolog n=1 Tax=Cacopsylla melanoneura TaxID=428564 RepID=A0A8D8W8X9_9HEMI
MTFLEDAQVRSMSSGNGQLVLGDSQGSIHLISRNFTVHTFKAYQIDVTHLFQSRHSSKLISIGNDEVGINPLIKVWDLNKPDRHDDPTCIRISRSVPQNRAVAVTCLSVCESSNLMAVGHQDGSIIVFRGEIGRDKGSKQKVLKDGNQPITGLAFRTQDKKTYLFVTTLSNVQVYSIEAQDIKHHLTENSLGCTKRCSVMTESNDTQFVIAQDKAIYSFTTEGKGPCFVVDGTKEFLQCFRSHLVIVANDTESNIPHVRPGHLPGGHTVTVLDISNKFIVYSAMQTPVVGAVAEWGSLFLLSKDYNLHQLNEKDLQSKLSLLFKKNLYDIAIKIAKSNHYDKERLVEIFRQYGDHLYAKGDHYGAIKQYIKTIGRLEPSYVIRKFQDSQHIEKLTEYLAALHKAGSGLGQTTLLVEHTTLLLNCYTKLNHIDQLKHFLMTKDSEVDFDVDVAIKVCRQSSSEDALLLAEKHGKHAWYLKIQIEDHARYLEALIYIGKLPFNEAETNIKVYGKTLLDHIPHETCEFLKKLCTDYKPSNTTLPELNHDTVERAQPEEFIHFFLDHSLVLVEFLEHILNYPSREKCRTQVYNTLIEHYLCLWNTTCDSIGKETYTQKVMRLLSSDDIPYDKNQALLLCHSYKFSPGLLLIYKERKLYDLILSEHISRKDYAGVLSCCRAYGSQNPILWQNAFHKLIKDSDVPGHVLSEILRVIEQNKLLSPLFMLDALSTSSSVSVGLLRNYFLNVLSADSKKTETEVSSAEKYTKDTEILKSLVQQIQSKPVIFQGSRCSVCNETLELPSVHFLCQHSFHKHCFQSFSESDKECPACLPKNKHILDIIQSQEPSKSLNEVFHSDLEKADDPFGVVAKYLGRGVFNKLTLVTNGNPKRKNQSGYSQSSATSKPHVKQTPTTGRVSKPANTNPFEDYDESKNPFGSSDHDYDETLNPFS